MAGIEDTANINKIILQQQAGDPSTPAAGTALFYLKSDGLYCILSSGSVLGPFGTAGAGSGLAPADATYVTLTVDGDLSAERTLSAGEGLDSTDGGAGSTISIDLDFSGMNYIGDESLDEANDLIAIYDDDASEHKYSDVTEFLPGTSRIEFNEKDTSGTGTNLVLTLANTWYAYTGGSESNESGRWLDDLSGGIDIDSGGYGFFFMSMHGDFDVGGSPSVIEAQIFVGAVAHDQLGTVLVTSTDGFYSMNIAGIASVTDSDIVTLKFRSDNAADDITFYHINWGGFKLSRTDDS